jgi:hypothetical protein
MLLLGQIRDDLFELARLVSMATASHSVAIFLPSELLSASLNPPTAHNPTTSARQLEPQRLAEGRDLKSYSIDLAAVYSLSKPLSDCRIQVGNGLLGWVAEQGKPIHLTQFEGDSSRSLGIYLDNEPITSLVAVPIKQQPAAHSVEGNPLPCGVVMCDRVSAEPFSNAQIKLIEQSASIAQRIVNWTRRAEEGAQIEASWDLFKERVRELGDAIGHDSVELLRIKIDSLHHLEVVSGISVATQLAEQFLRLAHQALPPHFPCIRVPNGDIAIAVDNMMSGFFQQKLSSISSHLSSGERVLNISIECYRAKPVKGGKISVDATLQQKPLAVRTSAFGAGGGSGRAPQGSNLKDISA